MTGMKEGAGEDPFAEDTEASEQDSEPSLDQYESEKSQNKLINTPTESKDNQPATQEQLQIPYKYRRDSVQDGRDRVPLFLQPETKTAEREALRELEERFDDSISLTDLREALVKVGLEHLDETEQSLEEWGYGMTFD